MFLIMLNQKLHLAPIKEPRRVLDLGCGTGIWCMDMADGMSLRLEPLRQPLSLMHNMTNRTYRVPRRRDPRRRPLPHPTAIHTSQLQIRNRRRDPPMDLHPALRLHQHPLLIRLYRRLASALHTSLQQSRTRRLPPRNGNEHPVQI